MSTVGISHVGANETQFDCKTVPLAQNVSSVSLLLPFEKNIFHAFASAVLSPHLLSLSSSSLSTSS
jgi:hypothetical protein